MEDNGRKKGVGTEQFTGLKKTETETRRGSEVPGSGSHLQSSP